MSSHPAQNGSNITDAGQSRIPVKAMAGVAPTYPAKAALARPVTVILSRLALAPSRLRIPREENGGQHDDHHIHSLAQCSGATIDRNRATHRRAATAAIGALRI